MSDFEPQKPCFFLVRQIPGTKDVQFSLSFDLEECRGRMQAEGYRAFEFTKEVFLGRPEDIV